LFNSKAGTGTTCGPGLARNNGLLSTLKASLQLLTSPPPSTTYQMAAPGTRYSSGTLGLTPPAQALDPGCVRRLWCMRGGTKWSEWGKGEAKHCHLDLLARGPPGYHAPRYKS
jgi:hypothetical protein